MDPEMGSVSARLEPEHLNIVQAPRAEGGGWSRCGVVAGWLVGAALLLCLTTTTALVAVQQIQLRAIESKLDALARRVPDIPSLISTLGGEVVAVQDLVTQGLTQTLLEAELQGARIDHLAEGFAMLVRVLQEYFTGIGA